MKQAFSVVFENGPNNLSAYAPDLPGCVSVGDTLEEARKNMREAIIFHVELVMEHGQPVPTPRTSIQEASELHDHGLSEMYQELGEQLPEPTAIVEVVEVEYCLRESELRRDKAAARMVRLLAGPNYAPEG